MLNQKNLGDVKIINRANVLRMICEQPGVTRQEIASALGLTKMSVANIITEYVGKGLVQERVDPLSDPQRKNAGRPSFRVYVVPNSVIVLSLFISEMEITCSLVNFECKTLLSRSITPTKQEDNDELFRKADDLIAIILREGGEYTDRLMGIGISSVGLIDSSRGCIIAADNFPNIRELPVTEYFSGRYNLPVLLANDMDASAVAERHYGRALGMENFIYMGVNSCIGMGIYINDAIYRGFNGFTGEIGYTSIDYRGKHSSFGHRGRLESYVRIDRYVKKVNRDIAQGVPGIPDFPSYPVQWKDIAAAAQAGNDYCQGVIRQIGDYLAIAVVNVLNIFDPEKIVLGGQIALAGEMIIDYIREQTRGQSLASHFYTSIGRTHLADIPLELSAFSDRSAVIGAGAIFFEAYFHGTLSML